ncbi:Os10g0338500 [Oryza sativa Japonica Group]|uniref:Os10g0338500 protein n=1 Tax=Oryza sativa subsp. japonica TaxID=39947 RepID=Q0IYC3_ORYSJ|nr:Os10g0338500 [Oryza sativa Japonica Group]|eukprot:NP_001064378.1 Os10g0338500 [Oryza sativa Japonica Group]
MARNEVARFQIWSGPEAPFVSAGPDWKRASLPPSWPGFNPHLPPSGSNPDARQRRAAGDARRRRGGAPTSTATASHPTYALSAAFSPVTHHRRLPLFLLGFLRRIRLLGPFVEELRERRGEGEEEEEEERALPPLAAALEAALALLLDFLRFVVLAAGAPHLDVVVGGRRGSGYGGGAPLRRRCGRGSGPQRR